MNPPRLARASLTLSALFLAAPALSAPPDARALLEKVQSFYRGTSGIEAKFTQQIDSRTLGAPQQESGTVYLKPPGRMRWEYSRPKGKLAVADGAKVFLYLPEDRQVLVGTLKDLDAGATVTRLLWGEAVLGDDFRMAGEPEEEPGGLLAVRLESKSPDFPYTSLILHVSPKDGTVPRIELIDPLGNRMEYRFADIRSGRTLPDKLFTYQIPRGVEIQMLSEPRATPRPSP